MPGKLADVAKQAGVSEATVSRVLNGKPGISDATRAAVLTALDVIGYERPTHLRDRRARMVGLVVPELQNPIFPALDAVAMEQSYAHLASLGHERIGLILGPPDHVPSRRKLTAYESLSPNAGLVERTRFSIEGGHAAASRLLAAGVTGVICASDPLALGAIRAVRRAGMSVPADVSVVGYDDSAFMSCTDPPLTTVRQPIDAVGRAAVELLTDQIEGAQVAAEELFFEPEIVARGSTAAARVRA